MKKILALISLPLLIVNCEKEKIIEIEKEYNWKKHESFQYNDVAQMNSLATNDQLYFLGHNTFTSLVSGSLDHPDALFGGSAIHYDIWYEQPSDRKLPICADYFISYNKLNGWLRFIPTQNPVSAGTSVSLSIKNIDSTYTDFDLVHFSVGECMVINEQNKALIPYVSFVDSKMSLKLALVNIKKEILADVHLDTIETRILSIPEPYQHNSIIESIGDNFFFITNSKVYRIDNLGNIENVLDTELNKIIESEGKLYGISTKNLFISSDNGLTWNEGYTIPYIYSSLNYTKIDNKIIGYRYNQLWNIVITDSEISAQELDNNGLDGISITSVSNFDKKAYISSLSGVYFKPLDDFFNYRNDVE